MKPSSASDEEREYLPPRTRIRLTELGRERHPQTRADRGVIIRSNATGSAYVILFDGAKTHATLHHSYVEPERRMAAKSSESRP